MKYTITIESSLRVDDLKTIIDKIVESVNSPHYRGFGWTEPIQSVTIIEAAGMNPFETRLSGELLKQASDKFSNHGCNDFKRPEWFPKDAWDSLIKKMYEENGDPENAHQSDIFYDWWLMEYLGNRLLKESSVKV